jgi:hypothetical protein
VKTVSLLLAPFAVFAALVGAVFVADTIQTGWPIDRAGTYNARKKP